MRVAALPTPDGYVGLLVLCSSIDIERSIEELSTLTGYFQSPFSGSPAQWETYLARNSLRAALFDSVTLRYDPSDGLRYESPRVHLSVPAKVLKFSEGGRIGLDLVYLMDGNGLTWGVGGITFVRDADGETYLGAYRQPKPDRSAGRELLDGKPVGVDIVMGVRFQLRQ